MRRRLVLAFILVLGICFLLLFIPSLFKKQVADLLRNEMNNGIYGDVSFSNADINLWRNFPQFTFTFNDFVISGKKQFRGDTLITTREFHVIMASLPLLFDHQVEIRNLNLIDPHIHAVIHSDGKQNYNIFSGTDTTSDTSGNVILEIESWTIENGVFFYDDHENDFSLKGEGLFLTGDADLSGNIMDMAIVAATSGFTANYGKENFITDKDISLDLQFTYDLKDKTLRFSDNRIQVNNLALTTSGAYQMLHDSHYFDVKFQSENSEFRDVVTLSKYFSADLKKLDVKGHFIFDGSIKGKYIPHRNIIPSFRANLKVTDGSIRFEGLPSSLNKINFNLVAENKDSLWINTILDLKKFTVNFGSNPFEGSLLVRGLDNSYIKSDIAAKINLEDLKKVYPMQGISVAGKLDLDIKADGRFHTGNLNDKQADLLHTLVPPFTMEMQVTGGTFKYDHLPEAITGVNFQMKGKNTTGRLENTSLEIGKLEGKLGDNPVKGFINIDGFRDPFIRSELIANIDLADIKDFFPIEDMTLEGLFDMDMKVNGQLSPSLKKFPKIDTKINLVKGFIQSAGYPAPMENTHLILEALNETGELKDTRLTIDTLIYSIEGESFLIEGQISDLEKYAYDLSVKGILYLDKVKKIMAIKDMEMAGEVDVDFKTAGTLNDLKEKKYHRLPTSGQIILKNVMFQNSNIPHGLTIPDGRFFFTNEKIMMDTLHGSVGLSNFSVTGHLFNYLAYFFHSDEKIRGNLRFESQYFNLDEIMGSDKISAKDTTRHLHVIEVPGNLDFVFDADIASLVYKNLEVNDLKGEITMNDGVLSLREATFKAIEADFKFSGSYDTRNMEHPLFAIHVNVQNLDITRAHDAFVTVQTMAPAAEHTYGVISADYSIKGELMKNLHPYFGSLEGAGIVRISDARINGMKLFHHVSGITKKTELMNPELKDIVMETNVKEGIVYVKPFSMKLAGFQTDIEGQHNLSGTMNYVLRLALPPFEIIKIPLHVSGTYDNPKVHLGKGQETIPAVKPAGTGE